MRDVTLVQTFALTFIGIPIISFIPLYAWKAHNDPEFCRSETHVQRVMKIELEMMGSESKQITAEALEQIALIGSIKEPLRIEQDDGSEKN